MLLNSGKIGSHILNYTRLGFEMYWQMLKLKRIKKKSDMPDRVKIHTIAHVYLNGDKFKIFVGKHEKWLSSTEMYLQNMMNGKWYELINEVKR